MIWSWSSATTHGGSLDCKFVTVVVPVSRMLRETEDEIMKVLGWSMQCLEEGIYPATDHKGQEFRCGSRRHRMAGRPLAGGFAARFAGWKGDYKARREVHRLQRWYNCGFICERCAASSHRPATYYGDFKQSAGWRKTEINHEMQVATTTAENMSPWLLRIRGFRYSRCLDDSMHCVHLGVAREATASAPSLVVSCGIVPRNTGVGVKATASVPNVVVFVQRCSLECWLGCGPQCFAVGTIGHHRRS